MLLGVPHQLLDEQGMAPRLGGDALGAVVDGCRLPLQQQRRQLARLARREWADLDAPHVSDEEPAESGCHRLSAGRLPVGDCVRSAIPQGRHHQKRRCVGRSHHLADQREAVGVGPLQIVDEDDQRPAVGEPGHQLPGGGEQACAQFERVEARLRLEPRRLGHSPHAAKHRERVAEQRRGSWQERSRLRFGHQQDLAAEGIDHAVDGLEGHRLALEAAPGKDHRAALIDQQAVEELAYQRGLAHPRLAPHHHRHRSPPAAHLVGLVEDLQLALAPHEKALARGARSRGLGGPRQGLCAKSREHVASGGPRRGIEAQQLAAQGVEVRRHLRKEGSRRRRIRPLLLHHHLKRIAREREPAGECLVEHDPDAVPVGFGTDGPGGGPLGRHVGDGANYMDRLRLVDRSDAGHQPEVEEDHTASGADEDVRRLDVAVDLARLVKRDDAPGELAERRAQPSLVEAGRRLRGRTVDLMKRLGQLENGRGAAQLHLRGAAGLRIQELGPAAVGPDVPDEVVSLDQLHREEPAPPSLHKLAKAHQVRVIDVLQGAKFVLEVQERGAVELAHRLEGDVRLRLAVERLVDHAHPAFANAAKQLEAIGSCKLVAARYLHLCHSAGLKRPSVYTNSPSQ